MPTDESRPEVAVVMSVYNGASQVGRSVESILQQTHRNFEFIIIDDGSQDHTCEVLESYARLDPRIRISRGANQGLTKSLDEGCRLATAPLIARQDAGDVSLPERLQLQVNFLRAHSEAVAVGCGSRRLTEQGEFLGQCCRVLSPNEVTRVLRTEGIGILHPASMFRREIFLTAGGYRSQFRYAQDTDLWLRLSEYGDIAELPDVHFELTIDDHGISASRIDQQVALWKLARQCAEARRRGESELELLAAAERVSQSAPVTLSPQAKERQKRRARYFIGSQLYAQGNSACRRYLKDSLRVPSLLLPSAAKILMSFSKCRQQ